MDMAENIRKRHVQEATDMLAEQNSGRLGLPSTLNLLKPSLFAGRHKSLRESTSSINKPTHENLVIDQSNPLNVPLPTDE